MNVIFYPEPANRAIVGWFDSHDSLAIVVSRDDAAAAESGADPGLRWWESPDDGPTTWETACHDARGLQGPFLLRPEPIPAEVTSRG